MAVREIGRYLVAREIGRGGMAVVHLAHERDLDRDVALKELAGLWATDPVATARFLREARLAGALNHPNIVVVYEYFEHGGIPFIAMEHLPRGSLRPLVGGLTDAQVVGVLADSLAGLAHANEHGIVHRDLKPENLMRTGHGTTKIADFGIATAYDELAGAHLTPLGEFVGAPGYVSPEQVVGEEATTRSDLYSVGVIAYELFTGDVPFAGSGSGGKILIDKVGTRAPSLATARPDLDKRLVAWVDQLLERDPAKRPPDPASALERLETTADSLFGSAWRRHALLPAETPAGPAPGSALVSTKALRSLELLRRLLPHAAIRPLNVLVPAGVLLAAAVLDSAWLVLVALGAYAALIAITLLDEREALRIAEESARDRRVGGSL